MDDPRTAPPDDGLRPRLGLPDATLLVMGTIIGAGIFSTPGFVAELLPSPGAALLAWVLGGLIALAGALSYAELGATWPRAGGHYVYMRLAYGPFWGFVDGWAALVVNFPGSIAALALALAAYTGEMIPPLAADRVLIALPIVGWRLTAGHAVAVGAIVLFSAVNDLGVRAGAWVQDVVTAAKIGVFALFIVAGFVWQPAGSVVDFAAGGPWFSGISLSAMGAALVAVMFTYSGWDSATYVASEVRRPSRNLPRAALWGTLAVMAIYLALVLVFFRVVPPGEFAGSIIVADAAARAIFGPVASRAVTAAIIVSILGALNAMVLTGPRVTYAMARDGLFFSFARKTRPERSAPSAAIWTQCGIAGLLSLTGTFEALFTVAGFVITLLAGATAAGVLVLRRKYPDVPRPYRAWGAPATPFVFAAAALWIAAGSIIERPSYALGGLAVVASAWPAYFLFVRIHRRGAENAENR